MNKGERINTIPRIVYNLLHIYFVPVTILKVFHALTPLIFTTPPNIGFITIPSSKMTLRDVR